jgi:hypothetical protein
MKNIFTTALGVALLVLMPAASALAQSEGDYRSTATGDWSAAATWEVFESGDWTAAATAPTGAETITVRSQDSVSVDIAVSVSGHLAVTDTSEVAVTGGSLEIADGGVYEHGRDGGAIPSATWSSGSTVQITGVVDNAPGNSNQSYHHVVFNTPGLTANEHMSLDDVTIGGDITVIDTGIARWYLTSTSANDTSTVTITGDVLVEAGQFAVQGTGNALTTFIVDHHGDITVTGGNFSISRGSQGSGSGTTTWNLFGGDLSMSNADTQNSNPTPGNAKFVFAGNGTQALTFDNVNYAGGDIHFAISDTTTLQVNDGFVANGQIENAGVVEPLGALTFSDGGIYVHARDGGTVPAATWEEGSTAMFTGITASGPDGRGQDYYNLVLNTPGLASNLDLSLDGNTVGGDLSVLSSGSVRWRLVGGSSGTVTIMGDLIVQDAFFETQGTGSATDVVVNHFGSVMVDGGEFSVSRGSQSGGTGTTVWNLHGDFSMSNAQTRNSNPTPGNARFVFASAGTQTLTLGENNTVDDLSVEVSDSTTVDLGVSEIGGDGIFWAQAGATLLTSHADGLHGNIQTTGDVNLGTGANVTYNGTVAQADSLLPDTLGTLTVANAEGFSVADTNYVSMLVVDTGASLAVDSTGSLTVAAGQVDGAVVNNGELIAESAIAFGGSSTYDHARDGGSVPAGTWAEGSTAMFTGITGSGPDGRGQDYYNLVLNTPGLLSNLDLSLDGNTIGGDLSVLSSGSVRWRLVGGSSGTVTIMGDLIVQDAFFETQGTGSATDVVVNHFGNVMVDGGEFSVSRGSQLSGTGTTIWNLHGDFSMANAQTRNSNPTPGNARFVFAGGGTQTLTLGENNTIDDLSIEVSDSTTLDVGLSEIGGDGIFWLPAGASVATSHADGLAGSIQSTGDVALNTAANFTFNGTDAQVTSTLMPVTVNDLVSDNEAGVALSQETTIDGVLRLVAGIFDNTIPFALGPGGSISEEGGTLAFPVSNEEHSELPERDELHSNYPNPFRASTAIRYDIKERADVTITVYDVVGREVIRLVDANHAPGRYQVEWKTDGQASGVYYYKIVAGDFSTSRSMMLVK